MKPNNSVNLERFLASYKHFGAFYLIPAILNHSGTPDLLYDLAILKRNITVTLAKDIGTNDSESVVLGKLKK